METRKSRSGRCGSGGGDGQRRGGASLRPRANPRSAGMWERVVAAVNLVFYAPAPLPFYIARVMGPTSHMGWTPPIRACSRGPARSLDRARGHQLQHDHAVSIDRIRTVESQLHLLTPKTEVSHLTETNGRFVPRDLKYFIEES